MSLGAVQKSKNIGFRTFRSRVYQHIPRCRRNPKENHSVEVKNEHLFRNRTKPRKQTKIPSYSSRLYAFNYLLPTATTTTTTTTRLLLPLLLLLRLLLLLLLLLLVLRLRLRLRLLLLLPPPLLLLLLQPLLLLLLLQLQLRLLLLLLLLLLVLLPPGRCMQSFISRCAPPPPQPLSPAQARHAQTQLYVCTYLPPIYLFIYLPICLSTIYLSIHPSNYSHTYLTVSCMQSLRIIATSSAS